MVVSLFTAFETANIGPNIGVCLYVRSEGVRARESFAAAFLKLIGLACMVWMGKLALKHFNPSHLLYDTHRVFLQYVFSSGYTSCVVS